MTPSLVVFALGMLLWSTFVSVQLIAICVELRKLRADYTAQAQLIARVADNAKDGARFLAEHRQRIARLERIAVPTHAESSN